MVPKAQNVSPNGPLNSAKLTTEPLAAFKIKADLEFWELISTAEFALSIDTNGVEATEAPVPG